MEPKTDKNVSLINWAFDGETSKKGDFALSNSNTTVERIAGDDELYSGILCTENQFMGSLEKKNFSIKIDKTSSSRITFGFCAKTADNIAPLNGYHDTQSSFMLGFHFFSSAGSFYSRSTRTPKYYTNELECNDFSNQILSASLDVKQKTIGFYLNGKLMAPPKEIDLQPEEAEIMCPCVDLIDLEDKVSLVFQELE